MVQRLCLPSTSHSFFLFGARGTGKSTLLRQLLKDAPEVLWIDLLDPNQEDAFALDPGRLKRMVAARESTSWVVIDEVQKVPRLLDVVHGLIESSSIKFALTGSSARKLKAGHANMLAGRALVNHLFPLSWAELGEAFSLEQCLAWGSLPGLLGHSDDATRREFLTSYAQVYLREEVWAEQLVRKLDLFRKFLPVAAQMHGLVINASQVARDVGCDVKTVQSYFQILEDTLVGLHLEAFHTSVRQSIGGKPKFYFFDGGVQRALSRMLQVPLVPRTSAYGEAFESFLVLEFHRLNAYLRKDFRFSFLRTKDDVEIDLIVERPGQPMALLEFKSTDRLQAEKLSRFAGISKDFPGAECYCLSQDPEEQKFGHITALPWQSGLKRIFQLA